MRIIVASVGRKPPAWIEQGFEEYRRRIGRGVRMELTEVSPVRCTSRGDLESARREEGKRLLAAAPANSRVTLLDERGEQCSTVALADGLASAMREGHTLVYLIGGANGVSPECHERVDRVWSLSRLTFPHLLVRVLVAEQLYRAWGLLHNLPYHKSL